jgi:hypothetical protein
MKARFYLLWLALTVLIATTVSACSSEEVRQERARQVLSQEDAELLGPEIFDLVDQAAGYQSSHSDRRPRSLRHMGVDSLTSTTARWIETRNDTLRIVVAFRRLSGHAVSRCSGDADVLEQLSLEGAFRLECALVDGTGIELTVGRPSS